MMKRSVFVLLGFALVSIPQSLAQMPEYERIGHQLFGQANVIKTKCPEDVLNAYTEEELARTMCGQGPKTFSTFKTLWDLGVSSLELEAMLEDAPAPLKPFTAWELGDGGYSRIFTMEGGLVGVGYLNGLVFYKFVPQDAETDSNPEPSSAATTPSPPPPPPEPVIVPAKITYKPPAEYPKLARKAGIEAKVYLMVELDEHGMPTSIKVLSCTAEDLGFEQAATDAVREWQWWPEKHDGVPRASTQTVSMEFTIN